MNKKSDIKNSASNIIFFKNHKKIEDNKLITSTIAAILAIKIEHPKDIKPEEFLINQIEAYDSIEILAFEDALDNDNIGLSTLDAQNEAFNDA